MKNNEQKDVLGDGRLGDGVEGGVEVVLLDGGCGRGELSAEDGDVAGKRDALPAVADGLELGEVDGVGGLGRDVRGNGRGRGSARQQLIGGGLVSAYWKWEP